MYMYVCMHTSLYITQVYIMLMSVLNVVKAMKNMLGRVYVRENFNLALSSWQGLEVDSILEIIGLGK